MKEAKTMRRFSFWMHFCHGVLLDSHWLKNFLLQAQGHHIVSFLYFSLAAFFSFQQFLMTDALNIYQYSNWLVLFDNQIEY